MKKFIAILLVLLLAIGSVSCGKKEEDGGSGGGEGGNTPAADVVIFQNLNVRKAMAYAIDRVSVAASLNDGSVAAEGIIPFKLASNPVTGQDFRDEQGSVVGYDPDLAKECYEKACEELGVKKLSLNLLYGTNEGDSVIKAAEQIAYYLEEAGFEVTLVSKQKKERLQLMDEGSYDVALTRWGPDYGDPQTYMDLYLSYNESNNAGRYNSAVYDKQVLDAEATTDPSERWSLFLDAEKTLVQDDFGIVPVFQAGGAMIIRTTISGIQFHSAAVDNYRHIVGKDEVTLITNTDIVYLDYQYATDGTSFIAETLFTSGLTELDADGNWVLDLAESYEVSDDGTVYTFKIRDDANWVDVNGNVVRTVTAQDFVDAWDRLISEELASDYSWWISDVLLANKWEAVDEKTFRVTLDKANGIFMSCLAFPSAFPINKEFIDEKGDQYATTAESILSCGPYILSSWTPGYSYEMVRNDNYYFNDEYTAAGTAKKIVFRVLEDTQTALMEYEAGNIDTVILSGEQVTANKDKEGFVNRLQGYLFYLSVNINHYE